MRTFPGFEKKISKIWHTIHNFMAWPLTKYGVRQAVLTAIAHVAEGAKVVPVHAHGAVCAALADPPRRLCTFHGRDGMAHALGSVYACFVTLFLGGCFRGQEQRRIHTGAFACGGMAVGADGATLYLTDLDRHVIRSYALADGAPLAVVGRQGSAPLQFDFPRKICVAPDGFIFVADAGNDRVQELTPCLSFSAFVGVDELRRPWGVCADNAVIATISAFSSVVSVFGRGDRALLWRFNVSTNCRGAALALTPPSGNIAVGVGRRTIAMYSVQGTRRPSVNCFSSSFDITAFASSAAGELAVGMVGECTAKLYIVHVGGACETFALASRATYVAIWGGSVCARLIDEGCVVVLQ
jgi:hypothetical protein